MFGFLPILSPERLAERFEPLVDYVAQKIGVPVRLETAPGYAEFVRRTQDDRRYDLLFTAPHFYYTAQRRAGYRVVARVGGRLLRAILVAPDDGPVRVLSDLRGRTLATPSAVALSTLLIRARLREVGLDPDTDLSLVPTPTHNASLLSVYKRFTAAAGLGEVPFERSDRAITGRLRILAQTGSAPQMPFSVSPRLPSRHAKAFAEALIGMSSSPEGKALLVHLHWPRFVPATSEEYDGLRRFIGN